MSEILKKEGMEELVPLKRETRSQTKRKEERKETAEEESQGEEDLELN
jgi:hypothetical protein